MSSSPFSSSCRFIHVIPYLVRSCESVERAFLFHSSSMAMALLSFFSCYLLNLRCTGEAEGDRSVTNADS